MQIKFKKMHGCGNDFIIIDARFENVALNSEQRILLCNRKRGIGCDQLIMLKASDVGDVAMQIYNADGGEVSACGNATRCVASLIAHEKNVTEISIDTIERLLLCEILPSGLVNVNMGPANSFSTLNLGKGYEALPSPFGVNVGNPHCVFIVDNAESIKLAEIGAKIEQHSLFPERSNVEFVSKISDGLFRLRVWERGAGITQACGSGACAVAWVLHQQGLSPHACVLQLDGGKLTMSIKDNQDIHMQGEVAFVYEGCIEL